MVFIICSPQLKIDSEQDNMTVLVVHIIFLSHVTLILYHIA